jgi:glycosyltransferase involved in cell wall biosynthesis
MKLLAICSSIDLSIPGGGIPVYWQLLMGFHEAGTEVIVVTRRGGSISSPWWRIYEKPSIENKAFDFALTNGVRLNKRFAGYFYDRRWKKKIDQIFSAERDIDGVLLLDAPHLAEAVPSWIREKYQVPTIYYETDIQNLPKYSLDHRPEKHKFPDYSQCDAVVCSFEQASQEFRDKGLQKVWTVPFGADPAIFSRINVEQDIDVFFSGYSELDREDWMRIMITRPSQTLGNAKFLVEGYFNIELGNAERIRSVSLDRYLQLCCCSKINLNILRRQFITAGVLNSRIFELASLESCIVSNPCSGFGTFFEPKKELVIVSNEKEAIDTYRWLLSSKEDRDKIGKAARQRILREHTYLHRAHQFLDIFKKLTLSD